MQEKFQFPHKQTKNIHINQQPIAARKNTRNGKNVEVKSNAIPQKQSEGALANTNDVLADVSS